MVVLAERKTRHPTLIIGVHNSLIATFLSERKKLCDNSEFLCSVQDEASKHV